jgi:methionyl-tRNA formyltransferase
MRFAIATVDGYLGVFTAFVHAGWTPVKLFTVPIRNEFGNQQAVIAFAEQNKAAIQLSRMNEHDLQRLRDDGCEILIVASYDWKIPDWQPYLKYAINFHSSPLPEGRGPYPSHRAILENRDHWAVACHKITSDLDSGSILAIENFPLRSDECHESLSLKIQMAGRKLAVRVAGQFTQLWENAVPQEAGSYWQKTKMAERIIDLNQPVEAVRRHVRPFGATGSFVLLGGAWLLVKRAVGWTEPHDIIPGTVVHVYNRCIVSAVPDGYIGFLEIEMASPQILAEALGDHPTH